jgi:serine/threonine protein kinase, bacterial
MTMEAGDDFAGYTIVRLLGSGGMGEVYLAQHPRLPRREALKILRPDISTDETFQQRFIREADSIAALEHPHIVTVHDRGDTDGRLWIATQYVDGTDATQLLRDRYPAGMPADEAVAITTAIAQALDHAHDRGLLHRDVKPANILLAQPDRAGNRRTYLADFGIARPLDDPAGLTATNFTIGTFAYAAPEQLMGKAIDGRADQYALAATAYHLLTGAPVFPDSNQIAVITAATSHGPAAAACNHAGAPGTAVPTCWRARCVVLEPQRYRHRPRRHPLLLLTTPVHRRLPMVAYARRHPEYASAPGCSTWLPLHGPWQPG